MPPTGWQIRAISPLTIQQEASMPPHDKFSQLPADRVQAARPGEPVEKWVYSAFQKDHWVVRVRGDLMHADHPGTAIQIGEDLFEVVMAEETAHPGYLLRYGLKKWNSQHALRGVIAYTPETQAQAAADFRDERHAQGLRSRIVWLFPLAGMAPDALQREWEAKTALNMTVVAAASALTQILIFMALVQSFGTPSNHRASVALEYVGLDAFVRLLLTLCTGKPRGIFALALPYLLWDLAVRPERRKRKKQAAHPSSLELDEIIRRPATGHLTICSMLFDDLLAGSDPIRFEGMVYHPLNWHREGKGLKRRWVYEFEKLADDAKVKPRDFTRPRSPQRQKAAEELTRSLDRTHALALLWGTYPAREQARLEAQYQFPAVQMTAATAGLLLVAGGLEAWGLRLLGAPGITYAVSLYFVFESLYRLYVSKAQAKPAGSMAGWVLGMFLHPPR
jgi:hypothetical protein